MHGLSTTDYADDRPHLFGMQRLWGSLGWGCVSLLSGWLVDRMSTPDDGGGGQLKNFHGAFAVMAVLLFADIGAIASIRVS